MLWRFLDRQRQGSCSDIDARSGSLSLQIVLWTLWSLVIAGVALLSWHADVVAQHPINTIGLVIHCAVAGVVGLVIMTKIEMQIEPQRFIDHI